MSAREKILSFVRVNAAHQELPLIDPETGHFVDDTTEHVTSLLDRYAHELAEKIRELGISQWEGMNESVRMLRKMRAQAADLIDPEVLNSGS